MVLLRRGRELVARRKGRRERGSRMAPVPTPPVPPPVRSAVALPAPDLQQLEAEARYQRDRLALYRARALSAKPTSAARMRELERVSTAADARLRHAAQRVGPILGHGT